MDSTKILDEIDRVFIHQNYATMSWNRLLESLNEFRGTKIKLSTLITYSRRHGLQKGDIQIRWSPEDIQYLRDNYREMGNVELAKKLTERKTSFRIIDGKKVFRRFTKKHIEKKMELLGLKRTDEEVLSLRKNNGNFTSTRNTWTLGYRKAMEENETRVWNGRRFIHIEGRNILYAPWFYEKNKGKIPAGYKIYHIDGDPLNDAIENLEARKAKKTSAEQHQRSLKLLQTKEKGILSILNKIDYDKEPAKAKALHADLNRIRKIKNKINNKYEDRSNDL
jgi:hypothetical protein